jgi:ubiquitin C-terminal hydrolase
MDITKYKNNGLSGLANLGNTCFINSCIQVLSHTYELNKFLDNETYKTKLKNNYDSVLLIEWDNLRKILWKENCVISPGKFIKTIQKVSKVKDIQIFTGYSQNDISEFLLFLISCFHNSLSRGVKMTISGNPENEKDNLAIKCFEMVKNIYSNDYSEIWNLFYAVHVSEIVRIDNGKVISMTPEPFFMVDLPIPHNNKRPSLIDCFDHYIDGEIIEDFKDENTKEKVTIRKRLLFWSLPNILVIDLKRFNNKSQKNQIHVNFPLDDLDLSKYVVGYKKEIYKYQLYGVCNHSGSTMGGHYTAFVKNANNKWYHFNDTSVSEVGLNESIISSKAYVLFYRKKIM